METETVTIELSKSLCERLRSRGYESPKAYLQELIEDDSPFDDDELKEFMHSEQVERDLLHSIDSPKRIVDESYFKTLKDSLQSHCEITAS